MEINEKKLTDEEIIKILGLVANDKEKDGFTLLAKNSLDLIYRLQDEKKHLSEEYDRLAECFARMKKTKAEQKAEIERLTKWYDTQSGLYNDLQDENKELKAEIERLTEDWKQRINKARQRQFNSLKKEELASAYEKLIESLEDELEHRQNDYMELQKQVDELKEQRDVFKRLFESVNTTHFSTDSIIETMNSFYREQAEHLAGLKIKQAVKDRTVEILQDLYMEFSPDYLFSNRQKNKKYADFIKEYAKTNYGVEVE